MTFSSWLLFCAIEFLLCLSPGPSVLLVSSMSLSGAKTAAGLATSGVLAANAMYFLIAMSGLSVLIDLSVEAFYFIKWMGAGYLLWIGLKIIWSSFRKPGAADITVSPFRALSQGFLTQAANPNLILYFSAILPQFIDPEGPAAAQMLILGASSLVVEGSVLLLYARAGEFAYRAGSSNARVWLKRAGGGLLLAAAVMLGLVDNARVQVDPE